MSKKWYCFWVYNNKDHKKKQFQSAFIKLPLLFYMEMKKKGGMLAIQLYIDLLLLGMKDHNFIKKIFHQSDWHGCDITITSWKPNFLPLHLECATNIFNYIIIKSIDIKAMKMQSKIKIYGLKKKKKLHHFPTLCNLLMANRVIQYIGFVVLGCP